MRGPLETRFWAKVDQSDLDACWPWRAAKNSCGYGHMKVAGAVIKAHRIAYALVVGPVPMDRCVLHTCDNPACVNPRHLELGTHAENMAQMVNRRRAVRGERHPMAKVTAQEVVAIRSVPISIGECARAFGLARQTVEDIRERRTWRHVE